MHVSQCAIGQGFRFTTYRSLWQYNVFALVDEQDVVKMRAREQPPILQKNGEWEADHNHILGQRKDVLRLAGASSP